MTLVIIEKLSVVVMVVVMMVLLEAGFDLLLKFQVTVKGSVEEVFSTGIDGWSVADVPVRLQIALSSVRNMTSGWEGVRGG